MDTIDSQIKLKNLDDVIDSAEVTLARAYTERAKFHSSADYNYAAAVSDLNKSIELEPWAYTYWLRGFARTKLGQLEQAQSDLTKSLLSYEREEREGFPHNLLRSDIYLDLGICYYGMKKYNCAIEELNRSLEEKDPQSHLIFSYRGLAFKSLRKYKEAIRDHSRCIQLEPDNPRHPYNKGIAEIESKRYGKAVSDLSRTLDLKVEDAAKWEGECSIPLLPCIVYHQRGFAYLKLKKYEEAFSDFSKAIQLEPKFDFSYSWRGSIYERRGEVEPAINDYQTALGLLEKIPTDKMNPNCIKHLIRVTSGLTRLGVDKSDLTAKYKELEEKK